MEWFVFQTEEKLTHADNSIKLLRLIFCQVQLIQTFELYLCILSAGQSESAFTDSHRWFGRALRQIPLSWHNPVFQCTGRPTQAAGQRVLSKDPHWIFKLNAPLGSEPRFPASQSYTQLTVFSPQYCPIVAGKCSLFKENKNRFLVLKFTFSLLNKNSPSPLRHRLVIRKNGKWAGSVWGLLSTIILT